MNHGHSYENKPLFLTKMITKAKRNESLAPSPWPSPQGERGQSMTPPNYVTPPNFKIRAAAVYVAVVPRRWASSKSSNSRSQQSRRTRRST